MTERMNKDDKEGLKALYTGLKELSEEEYRFLWEKYYLSTGPRAIADKYMAKEYGMEEREYRKNRLDIEEKLRENVIVEVKPLTTGKTIAEIINEVIEGNKELYGEHFNSIELKK